MKSKGKYREIYDTSRAFYDRKFPKKVEAGTKTVNGKKIKWFMYTDGHKYAMAKRRTVKLFLADFWAEWRRLEGLTVSVPFMHRGLEERNKINEARGLEQPNKTEQIKEKTIKTKLKSKII